MAINLTTALLVIALVLTILDIIPVFPSKIPLIAVALLLVIIALLFGGGK